MGNAVAYNPSDPLQQKFLSALALGESGNSPNGYTVGVGGTDLSGASLDQYGFPQWQGQGNSHAAGEFQFQPGTWKLYAQQYGLNWKNPADQNAAAWYYAQDEYAKNHGGSLVDALNHGDYLSIQNALGNAWPSVFGNAAAPHGLAADLQAGVGASILGGAPSSGAAAGSSGSGGGFLGNIEQWFQRAGLIIIGGLIILVALWRLMQSGDILPKGEL